jgi:hypothetical protein
MLFKDIIWAIKLMINQSKPMSKNHIEKNHSKDRVEEIIKDSKREKSMSVILDDLNIPTNNNLFCLFTL